jgi:hypothetical protein
MTKELIFQTSFQNRHKQSVSDFTRQRKLSFSKLLLFQLQKSVKSLQLRLNELCLRFPAMTSITKSAYSQARQKLRYTAFVELDNLLTTGYYSLGGIRTWHNYRLLAIDGSRIILPDSKAILDRFGGQKIPETRHHETDILPQGYLSTCYDVLNELSLNTVLEKNKSYELELAKNHQAIFQAKDLVLYDRHYASYEFIAWLSQQNGNFIIRCPRSTFREGMRVFEGGPWSRIVTLEAPGGIIKSLKQQGLPRQVTVRFVRVTLPTGEIEVLVTSLMEAEVKQKDFQEVYGLRWGIETYFSRIKERLNIENFTGKSVESVLQDLYSTVLVANLETIITEDINEEFSQEKDNIKYSKKVNKAVSYNLIKNQMFELLYDRSLNTEETLTHMFALFKQSPVQTRKGRQVDRNKSGPYRRLRYLKTAKKICY